MDGIDPDTLLEWLQTGFGDERDLQLMALEQLCMLLLISDNIDRCFESCPPRTFLPALCKIFIDETAPDNVLEVTARAITYYLDVSNECTRRITQVEGAVKAICARLVAAEMTDRTSKDLAEQCVKLLEHVCQRETLAVYDAGGMHAMLTLVRQHGTHVHKDTMHSAMSVVTRLCGKMEPSDESLPQCAESLGALLAHDDAKVSESALRCFAALTDRFMRKSLDPAELARHSQLVQHLLERLAGGGGAFASVVLSLLSNLCRGSAVVTEQVLNSEKLVSALSAVLTGQDERVATDGLRLADLLVVLLCEGRAALPATHAISSDAAGGSGGSAERANRQLIDAIRQKDTAALVDAVDNGTVDVNYTDDVGQTLLNWAAAFGTAEMVVYLCDKGADVNKGHKSSSLHYAACFGRPDIVKILLQRGANPDLRDEDGRTALDKARERSDEEHSAVASILESPSVYMHANKSEEDKKKSGGSSEESAEGASTSAAAAAAEKEKEKQSDVPDAELVRRVLRHMLPIFCEVFQKSMTAGVRRSSLSLIRKMVQHMSGDDLRAVSQASTDDGEQVSKSESDVVGVSAADSLLAVLVAVLDQDDDLDAQEQVLMIMSSLLTKDSLQWVDELIRLGVFEKVEAMSKQPEEGETAGGEGIAMEVEGGGGGVNTDDLNARNVSRCASSTRSVALESERGTPSVGDELTDRDRASMLNVPIQMEDDCLSTETPPPTVEVVVTDGSVTASSPAPVTRTDSASSSAASTPAPAPALEVVVATHPTTSTIAMAPVAAAKSDRVELAEGVAYRWREWRMARGRDALYVWADALAFEFCYASNGWFRYLVDGELWSMYSNGQAEKTAADEQKEAIAAFTQRWRFAKAVTQPDALPAAMLTLPSSTRKLAVPSWDLWAARTNELSVRCTKAARKPMEPTVVIKDDLAGFMVDRQVEGGSSSKDNTKHTVQAESTLPAEWFTGWATHGAGGRRAKFRVEMQRRRVQELAWELWHGHLKEARAKPREVLLRLSAAADTIQNAVDTAIGDVKKGGRGKHGAGQIEKIQSLVNALLCVRDSVTDERRLSTFELSVSGLVPALLRLLNLVHHDKDSFPAVIFKEMFSTGAALASLARKMVCVLEAGERFPQYLYDQPGGSAYGLQLLNRKIRMKLNHAGAGSEAQKHLLDRTGRILKSEPLTTVGQLKAFLLRMVAKQWYDRERTTFHFVKQVERAKPHGIEFTYTSDFDDQGIVYWLGTEGKRASAGEWVNPAAVGVVVVTCSDQRQPFGRPEDVLSRELQPLNCHTSDDKNAHFTVDLGVLVHPTAYTLRHARGYGRSALRNWLFQGSIDGAVWELLHAHSDDTSLGDPGSTASWHIDKDMQNKGPFRYFRIAQNGKNSSGQTHYLSLSGFEVYGKVMDVVTAELKPKEKEKEKESKPSRIPTSSGNSRGSKERDALVPAGADNNRLSLGGAAASSTSSASPSDQLSLLQSKLRVRMARENRAARELAAAAADMRGQRVKRGADWQWADQDGGDTRTGVVTSWSADGWLDVKWDNGYTNSYRYGVDGKYDVQRADGVAAPSALHATPTASKGSDLLAAVRRSTRSGVAGRTPSIVRPEPVHPHAPFKPRPPPKTGAAERHRHSGASNLSHFGGRQSMATPTSSLSASTSSGGQQQSASSIGKKSMSTTNLVDGGRVKAVASVAATGQAASAESLQHQTASLENLLVNAQRSRVFDDGLPEVADESVRDSPESARRATLTPVVDRETTSSVRSGGGSSRTELSVCSSQSSSLGSVSTGASGVGEGEEEEEESSTPRGDATPSGIDASNSLSVSAPDLALVRGRQQSTDAFETDEPLLEDEDEDDEGDDDDDRVSNRTSDSYAELLLETLGGGVGASGGASGSGAAERGLFERLRDVVGFDDDHMSSHSFVEQLLAPTMLEPIVPSPSSSSAGASGAGRLPLTDGTAVKTSASSTGSATSVKSKIGGYADLVKTMMQQMMDGAAFDAEEIEDEDMYEDEETDGGNEEETVEELTSALGLPESFAAVLGRGLGAGAGAGSGSVSGLSWQQLSRLVMGEAASRVLEARGLNREGLTGGASNNTARLRDWNDEMVLKCTYQALIPAFDPRPGRTNVNQTQDVELPAVIPDVSASSAAARKQSIAAEEPRVRLFLSGPNHNGVPNVCVEMTDDDASLFRSVQQLINLIEWNQKSERGKRVWEPTYTLSYEDASQPSTVEGVARPNSDAEQVPETVSQVLEVVRLLHSVGGRYPDADLSPAAFVSDKLTHKLQQELADPLAVAAKALPDWCQTLVYNYPCLFAIDTRSMYMQATAFGVSRAIVWLQSRREQAERQRAAAGGSGSAAGARRDEHFPEYRVGRIKHERIKVTRGEEVLLHEAMRVMRFHADRKAVLEVEYHGEEGTGLGPTLEFYALVAAELQRKALAIWLCDDHDEVQLKMEETELDLGEGKKPPGFYVRRPAGLFPAPLPPHTEEVARASEVFRILGIFLAKVLQDGRLVDLPLARPFLKLVVSPEVSANEESSLEQVLDLDDFEEVHPVKGRFLKELSALAQRKRTIEQDSALDREAKRRKIDELKLCINGTRCRVEDLALNFTVNPPSSVFSYDEMELVEGGAEMDVTMENVELYVEKCADFYLNAGIHHQMRAFREGFDRVFPLKSLRSFSPDEVQRLVSGEQCPEWTREDVLNYTEPKLGYARDSQGFLHFVDVLVGLNAAERKNFLQFATGCSTLPPGGLANLHPRLTVVRKESGDGSYPSVNTCLHYLKLPEYSSAAILRERLLTATHEKGFHLN